MIPGVHARIVIDRPADEVRSVLGRPGWPWLGSAGTYSTRQVELGPAPLSTFHLRVFAGHLGARNGATWRLRLHRPEASMSPDALLDLQLRVEAAEGRTRLDLEGSASRELAPRGHPVSRAEIREHAMAVARELLERIASAVEACEPSGSSSVVAVAPVRSRSAASGVRRSRQRPRL